MGKIMLSNGLTKTTCMQCDSKQEKEKKEEKEEEMKILD